jgi:DNA-binding NtrC family response regulator
MNEEDHRMANAFRERLDDYERRLILDALEGSGGHRRRAAAALGLLPSTLHEKMKRLGIWRPARPSEADAIPQSEGRMDE